MVGGREGGRERWLVGGREGGKKEGRKEGGKPVNVTLLCARCRRADPGSRFRSASALGRTVVPSLCCLKSSGGSRAVFQKEEKKKKRNYYLRRLISATADPWIAGSRRVSVKCANQTCRLKEG